MAAKALTVAAAVVLSACGGSGAPSDAGIDAGWRDAGPLDVCLVGAWTSEALRCQCDADGRPSPECQATDCEAIQLILLASDGSALQLDARRSESMGSISLLSFCPAHQQVRWRLGTDASLQIGWDGQYISTPVKCGERRMVRDENGWSRPYFRLSQALGDRLWNATMTGNCQGIPLSP